MHTIKEKIVNEIEIEHSRFIGIILPLPKQELLKEELNAIKKSFPKAKHYCYASKIGQFTKSSDDREPQGTAGRPMLELLIKNNLDQVLLVVVRYFGGILLGAGRLLRTYVDCASKVISLAKFLEIVPGFTYKFKTNYQSYDEIISFLKKSHAIIENSEFSEEIIITFFISQENDVLIKNLPFQEIKVISKQKTQKYMKEGM